MVGNKIGPVIGPQTNETYINIYTMDLACNFAVNGSIVVTVDDDFCKYAIGSIKKKEKCRQNVQNQRYNCREWQENIYYY